MKRNYFITMMCLICQFNIFSQVLHDTLDIEEVVITANKVQVDRENVPLSITLITENEIESSGEFSLLPLISEEVPGVFITQRGITGFGVSTGAAGGISIRGVGGSPNTQILMLINGQPQYMGLMTI